VPSRLLPEFLSQVAGLAAGLDATPVAARGPALAPPAVLAVP